MTRGLDDAETVVRDFLACVETASDEELGRYIKSGMQAYPDAALGAHFRQQLANMSIAELAECVELERRLKAPPKLIILHATSPGRLPK